jgi:hypothetical protein
MYRGTLIRSGGDAKTTKGNGEFETAIMYMAPHTVAGGTTLCSMAVIAACAAACLYSAGRGAFNSVQKARIAKAQRFQNDRNGFMAELVKDTGKFVRYCDRKGVKPAVRLNGTSDIAWENIPVFVNGVRFVNIMEAFPMVQFYDYAKTVKRVLSGRLPANYALTLSYSAASPRYTAMVVDAAKASGANVAVVFRSKAVRAKYMTEGFMGRAVIDGDRDDLRFLDPAGVVVGLYAKGAAKRDVSGFVVD